MSESCRGSLEHTSFASLLRPLVREGRTGLLRFTRAKLVKTVYLSEGRLIFATSTDADDRLGEMLLRKGLISYRALEDSVRAIQAGKRQGTILVESGAIKSRDLVDGVTEQVQDIIYGLFGWEQGEYEFQEGFLPSREVIVLRMSTGDLMVEGIRRVQSWGKIRKGVGSLEQRYVLSAHAPALLDQIALQREELNLVATLDGVLSVEQICGVGRPSDFIVCRTVWALWAAGILDRVPQDVDPRLVPSHDRTLPHAESVRGASVGAEIERFNTLHRFVFERVSACLHADASGFFERAFVRASVEHAPLFAGVAVDASGELDALALRKNIVERELARYVHALERLLEIETALARELLGEAQATRISDGLWALKEQQLTSPLLRRT
jgi:hypothetical protein